MTDERLAVYRQAAAAMRHGQFDFDLPIGPADDVGQLGLELGQLAETLEQRFEQFMLLLRVAASASEQIGVAASASERGLRPNNAVSSWWCRLAMSWIKCQEVSAVPAALSRNALHRRRVTPSFQSRFHGRIVTQYVTSVDGGIVPRFVAPGRSTTGMFRRERRSNDSTSWRSPADDRLSE